MEAILIILGILGLGFWFLFPSLIGSIFGIRFVPRKFGETPDEAIKRDSDRQYYYNLEIKKMTDELKNMSPEIVKQAEINIKNSLKDNSIKNIYQEAVKIQKGESSQTTIDRIYAELKEQYKYLKDKKIKDSDLDSLQKLFDLKKKGIITEDDFESAKMKILKNYRA
jgi:hypothetical protein